MRSKWVRGRETSGTMMRLSRIGVAALWPSQQCPEQWDSHGAAVVGFLEMDRQLPPPGDPRPLPDWIAPQRDW